MYTMKKKQKGSFSSETFFIELFNLNILTTKTNNFISITKFRNGEVLCQRSSGQDYKGPQKRLFISACASIDHTITTFFDKTGHTKKKIWFIVNFTGKSFHQHSKFLRYIIKEHGIRIYRVIEKKFFSFGGCRLQIKKRRKNKGRNKGVKKAKRLGLVWYKPKIKITSKKQIKKRKKKKNLVQPDNKNKVFKIRRWTLWSKYSKMTRETKKKKKRFQLAKNKTKKKKMIFSCK